MSDDVPLLLVVMVAVVCGDMELVVCKTFTDLYVRMVQLLCKTSDGFSVDSFKGIL